MRVVAISVTLLSRSQPVALPFSSGAAVPPAPAGALPAAGSAVPSAGLGWVLTGRSHPC